MKQYGKIIAKLRKERNMTQAELGAKLNVTYQAVSKWENDQSQPDFATMIEMAKLFNVPLNVFVDGDESSVPAADAAGAAVPAAEAPQAERQPAEEPVIGYCKNCGIAVRKKNLAQERPYILCSNCATELAEREKAEREKAAAKEAEKDGRHKHDRNRGLIWAAVITGVLLAAALGITIGTGNYIGIPVSIGCAAILYMFVAQLFWGGFVVNACLGGVKVIGTPGIIFSFDLDGFIFLIAMKILFALLRMLVFLVTLFVSSCFALVCSPFTFVPAMIRVRSEGREEI